MAEIRKKNGDVDRVYITLRDVFKIAIPSVLSVIALITVAWVFGESLFGKLSSIDAVVAAQRNTDANLQALVREVTKLAEIQTAQSLALLTHTDNLNIHQTGIEKQAVIAAMLEEHRLTGQHSGFQDLRDEMHMLELTQRDFAGELKRLTDRLNMLAHAIDKREK